VKKIEQGIKEKKKSETGSMKIKKEKWNGKEERKKNNKRTTKKENKELETKWKKEGFKD